MNSNLERNIFLQLNALVDIVFLDWLLKFAIFLSTESIEQIKTTEIDLPGSSGCCGIIVNLPCDVG